MEKEKAKIGDTSGAKTWEQLELDMGRGQESCPYSNDYRRWVNLPDDTDKILWCLYSEYRHAFREAQEPGETAYKHWLESQQREHVRVILWTEHLSNYEATLYPAVSTEPPVSVDLTK